MPENTTRRVSSIGQTSASIANVRGQVFSTLTITNELGDQNEEKDSPPSLITQMPPDSLVTLPLSPLHTWSQSFSNDLSTVDEFFSNDNGLGSSLTRVHSIGSLSLKLSRVSTQQSKLSVDTVLNDSSVPELTLEELCQLIDKHRSMQYAEIVSAEGYKEWTGTVVHRYLVLELWRDRRKKIWLRIDRRRSREVNMLTFLSNRATTPANDVAKLSATKNKLIVRGKLETVQRFAATPTLGDLRHLFRVIRDELQQYQLWPANCWFFVSLLHQHLGFTGDGVFIRGSLPNPKLAQRIRERVRQRMCLLYRIPDPTMLAMNFGVVRVDFAGDTRVDHCYQQAILQHVDHTNVDSLNQFRSITAHILCAQDALSLRTLVQLVPTLSKNDPGTQVQQRNITRLALLFTGTHKHDVPIEKPHSSLVRFLSDPACSRSFSIDSIDTRTAKAEMALGCLRIVQSELHFNICQLPTSFRKKGDTRHVYDPQSHISPQVLYASQHLMHHLTQLTTIDDSIIEGILIFFRQQFLSWLEVMSVTSRPFVAALRLLGRWMKRMSPVSEVAALIRDATRFVETFEEPITTSPTHIYLSALSFAPTHSKIHEHYFHLFPGINTFLKDRVSTWSDLKSDLDFAEHKPIWSVAFSPDGMHIVSASEDSRVCLWDARTGANIGKSRRGHTACVSSVAYSPDGTHIVSGSDDHTLRLWDARTGASIGGPLRGHTECVRSVAFSPDGTQIMSGSDDCTLRLWDARTGASIGEPMTGHTYYVMSSAFSPDGCQIVSGSADHTLRFWDAKTGASISKPLRGHTSWVMSVAFSPNGTQIVTGSADHTLQLWDVETGASIGEPLGGHTAWVESVAFSPDGKQIVSGSADHTLRLWDTRTRANIGEPLRGHTSWVMSVAFSPDGTQVVSCSDDGTIRIWDVTLGDDQRRTIALLEIAALGHDNPHHIDLQYPPKHFPQGRMHISEDGWILGPNNELLIWVPPVHRRGLKNLDTRHIIIGALQTELDFHKFKRGEEWAQCHDLTPARTLPIA